MRKKYLIAIILFNLAGLLVLATFKSPMLFPSLFSYYTNIVSGSEVIGIRWYFLLQQSLLLITFLVSTVASILTFFISSHRVATISLRTSLFTTVISLLVILGSFFIPPLCSHGGCLDLGGIFMLIFYAIFQTIFAFFIAKSMQANIRFPLNTIILSVSFLFLVFFSYATASCGYSTSTQDTCHTMIADQFIQIDECNKIINSSTKQTCINHVNDLIDNQNEYIAWRDHPLKTINDRITECQALPWERRITSGFSGGIMTGCYEGLVSDMEMNSWKPFRVPCTAGSLRTQEEEGDFLQCLRIFVEKDFINEEDPSDLYLRTCQELKGTQKESCLRIIR